MINKTKKKLEFTKGIFSTHNKVCQFEKIDGFKCLLHKIHLQISRVNFAAVL